MKPRPIPNNAEQFAELLGRLKLDRYERKTVVKAEKRARQSLSAKERKEILLKTGRMCHVCGGIIKANDWQADHVVAHASGGIHQPENYLPAHRLCNNYRWDYSPEEFQHILKLGIWLRDQIEMQTKVGLAAATRYLVKEINRENRRSKCE